jgi:translation initiation factor 1 (eIF-1/SUI1)
MGKKQKKRVEFTEGLLSQPLLGQLLEAGGVVLPAGENPGEEKPGPAAAPTPAGESLSAVGRVVLRFEKKGHGGKQATRVEGLPFPAESLANLARELRREMGCGAWVDQGTILLQGDLVSRLKDWFTRKGVKRVVVSGRGGSAG